MTFSEFLSEIDPSTCNSGWSGKIKTKISHNQREILNCVHDCKFTAIYKNRQDGITTALHLYTFWQMLEKPSTQAMMVYSSGSRHFERFRSILHSNSGSLCASVIKDNRDSILLSNGSRLFYKSYSQNGFERGMSLDIIIAEEFGEIIRAKNRRMEFLSSLISCVRGKNGKFIVTTSDMSAKETLSQLVFNEVYGYFFSGTRKVLTEKNQA